MPDRLVLPSTIPELPSDLTEALAAKEIWKPEFRPGYFGSGTRVHLWVGHPDHGWWCVCGGVPWVWNRTNPTLFPGQREPRSKAPVDCYRCAKAVGLIDRFPGPEERMRLEDERRATEPVASDWRPMSTAPRNGEVFVALLADAPEDLPNVALCAWSDGWYDAGSGEHGDWFRPTHWVPLPPVPKAVEVLHA